LQCKVKLVYSWHANIYIVLWFDGLRTFGQVQRPNEVLLTQRRLFERNTDRLECSLSDRPSHSVRPLLNVRHGPSQVDRRSLLDDLRDVLGETRPQVETVLDLLSAAMVFSELAFRVVLQPLQQLVRFAVNTIFQIFAAPDDVVSDAFDALDQFAPPELHELEALPLELHNGGAAFDLLLQLPSQRSGHLFEAGVRMAVVSGDEASRAGDHGAALAVDVQQFGLVRVAIADHKLVDVGRVETTVRNVSEIVVAHTGRSVCRDALVAETGTAHRAVHHGDRRCFRDAALEPARHRIRRVSDGRVAGQLLLLDPSVHQVVSGQLGDAVRGHCGVSATRGTLQSGAVFRCRRLGNAAAAFVVNRLQTVQTERMYAGQQAGVGKRVLAIPAVRRCKTTGRRAACP